MGKFESYPETQTLGDNDITLYNHTNNTNKITFINLVNLIKTKLQSIGIIAIDTGVGLLSGGTITSNGTIKCDLKSETPASISSANISTVDNRQYAVGIDKDGHLSVNVPWEGGSSATYTAGNGINIINNTISTKLKSNTQSLLTASNMGSTTNRQYAVGLDSQNYLSVNIPWVEYSADKGIILNNNSHNLSANLKSYTQSSLASTSMGSTANRQYAVGLDKDGYLSVNVPWEGGSTTYTAGSGIDISNNTIKVKLKSYTQSSLTSASITSIANKQYAVNLDSSGVLSVNVPWENTTYSSLSPVENGTDVSLVTTGEKYNWNNTGTVKQITLGEGLTGDSTITSTGTIKVKLKSYTSSSLTATSMGSTANRQYAVGLDASGNLSVNVPWENTLPNVTGVKGSSESTYRTGNINITAANIGLGNVGNYKAVSTVANQGLTDTEKANARANIGAGTSSFSGSYTDLTNKPTIPTVNNATLTIQKNGTNVQTFTANQASNATANITVPTKTSELTNDSGYTTNTGTVTRVQTGVGLVGDITTSGTIKTKLKSETASTLSSTSMGSTSNRQYAVGLDKDGYLSVNIPWDSGMAIDGNNAASEVTFSGIFTVGNRKANSTHGVNSVAEGSNVTASGDCSHAEGANTKASGTWSHAEGTGTVASGDRSHVEGIYTTASGDCSHAEGSNTIASGNRSHAEGQNTTAGYVNQHVIGKYNSNKSTTLFEVGNGSSSSRSNAFEVYSDGSLSTDNGTTQVKLENLALKSEIPDTSTFMTKSNPTGTGSFSLNRKSGTTIGNYSFAEGGNTTASGNYSHAEGSGTTASRDYSHAEGQGTTASGIASHAEGSYGIASGMGSHIEGGVLKGAPPISFGLYESQDNNTKIGRTSDTSFVSGKTYYVPPFRITPMGGENPQAMKWLEFQSKNTYVYTTDTIVDSSKNYYNCNIIFGGNYSQTANGYFAHAEGNYTVANGNYAHTEGQKTKAEGSSSHAEGYNSYTEGNNSHAEGNSTQATSEASHAEGKSTLALGNYSHAEGHSTTAQGITAHAEGRGSIASGAYSHAEGRTTTSSGDNSHAEGQNTTASGTSSHAEGQNTTASGSASHAEGYGTTASGELSHAEGNNTNAHGENSHAECDNTIAYGKYSHAEGNYTTAQGEGSHAEGKSTGAVGDYSHAGGAYVGAYLACQLAQGGINDKFGNANYGKGVFCISPDTYQGGGTVDAVNGISCANLANVIITLTLDKYAMYMLYWTVYSGTNDTNISTGMTLISTSELSNNPYIQPLLAGTIIVNTGAHSITLSANTKYMFHLVRII